VVRGGNKPAIFPGAAAMNINPEQLKWVLISVLVLVASVAIHEFGHAKMADMLGDDTPRRQGRVTLNPLAHADPIGTLLLPLIGGLYVAGGGIRGGFGWGRPVQWNPTRINRKWRMATAQILVAVAGPSMNVVLALLVAGVHAVLWHTQVLAADSQLHMVLLFTVHTNFILFFFNLVPVPPLDGGHVADGLLPYKHRAKFEAYARFGPFIVMALVLIPQIAQIFRIPAAFCTRQLYDLLGIFT
jgi:Zn-dependent protease